MKTRSKVSNLLYVVLPKNAEIHHIDLDRNNDNINNLVMLTRKYHRQLHKAVKKDPLLKQRKFLINYLRSNHVRFIM